MPHCSNGDFVCALPEGTLTSSSKQDIKTQALPEGGLALVTQKLALLSALALALAFPLDLGRALALAFPFAP